ncbi:MAG: TonB family protein [Terriglobales bacterium]
MRGTVGRGARLALAGMALALAAATPPPPAITATLTTASWTHIPLPLTVLTVAAQPTASGPVLWAGGLSGGLWRSGDGGRTWSESYRLERDDLISAIAWTDAQHGFAAGSYRLWLKTSDGGQSWQRSSIGPQDGVRWLAMGDRERGLAAGLDTFWLGSGGRWQGRAFAGRPAIQGVAVLDQRRMAILLDGGKLEISSDGGGHWSEMDSAAARPLSLVAGQGRYWVFGETSGRAPHPYGAFQDVKGWRALASVPASLTNCTWQGCIANERAWYAALSAPAAYERFPAGSAIRSWAAGKGTICVLGNDGVNCAMTMGQAAPPGSPTKAELGSVQAAKCAYCPAPPYPFQARTAQIDGTVVIQAIIGKTGAQRLLVLESAPDVLLARAAMHTVQTWRYKPTLLQGKPVESFARIVVDFRLY